MQYNRLVVSICLAIGIGIAQLFLLAYALAYFTAHVPVSSWFLSIGLKGNAFYVATFVFATICNLLLCVPGALALLALRPRRLGLYTIGAVLPGFLWQSRALLGDPMLVLQYASFFLPGMALALLALPITLLLCDRMLNRHAA